MFSKMFKSAKLSALLGVLCVMLLVGGIYFYQQNATEQVPIKIYRVPEVSQQKADLRPASFQQPAARSTTLTPSSDSDDHESAPPLPDSIDHVHPYESDPFLTDSSEPEREAHLPDASEPEEMPGNDSDFSERLASQIEALTAQMEEKYPEVTALPYLSLDEINELYPTPEARAALQEQSLKAQEEFMGGFRSLFSEVPEGVVEESLLVIRELFTDSWGAETADLVIAELRAGLGL